MSSPNKRTIRKGGFKGPVKKVVLFGTFFCQSMSNYIISGEIYSFDANSTHEKKLFSFK